MHLPPMVDRPSAATFAHLENERRQAGRRLTNENKARYRAALLRWAAAALTNPGNPPEQPYAAMFDLTAEQGTACRTAVAKVLAARANSNGGRVGRR